ncbi:MAG: SpoIIE family protein phosphatase [Candidatus Riflebacteria bacterium]|nr:SpoIIE family protein phosphatase [Candidatus Riflebacteria bacterium]
MKSFFAKLLAIFIFGLLPATSLYLVAHQLLGQQRTARVEAVKTQLRGDLIRVADASSAGSFYFRLLEGLLAQIYHSAASEPDQAARMIRRTQNICGPGLAVYLFDEKGSLINLPGYAPQNRFVISKLWEILAETPEYQAGEEQRQLKRIQTLLGAEANAGRLINHEGQLLSLKKKRSTGYFFWKRKSPKSYAGAVIIVFPVLTSQQILKTIFRSQSDVPMHLTFWNHDLKDPIFSTDSSDNFNYLREKLEKSSAEYLIEADKLWLILNTGAGVYLGSMPVSGLNRQNSAGMLNLLMALVLGGLAILLFNSSFSLQKMYLRIGNKLLALLLVAIAIPAAGLLLTGLTAISTHEKVLWSRIEKEKITRLSAIEDDFYEEERSFHNHCMSLRSLIFEKYSYQEYARQAGELIASGQAVRLDLIALNGEPISSLNKGGWFEGLEKSQDAYGRFLIEKLLKHRSKSEGVALKRRCDAVFTDAFASSDFGFAQITEAPDQVHTVRFGVNELLWYWTLIDVPRHPAAVLSVFQAKNIARENFLRRVLRRSEGEKDVLAVYDHARRSWLNNGAGVEKECEELMRAAILTDKPVLRKISGEKRSWLALAFPGKVLTPYSLLILTDEQQVRSRVSLLYQALAAGLVVIFAIALLVAWLLTEAFVKPVKELDRGMTQIQKLQSDAKVEIATGDEFGELGQAFNQMVDELNEMQLAKSVQEALFPQEKMHVPGFDTAIFNLPATDLGGDYCDYMKLGEHKYLFLIGDVSGHGTSAAMCMAMAKAAIFKACREGLDFMELPGNISSLLLRTVKRKKMMTMLFALLDSENATLQLINAGHNWPVVIRCDGSTEEIELVGLPLGICGVKRRGRGVSQSRCIELRPGEILFSYTDALIECQAPNGDILGHKSMYVELAKLAGGSPDSIVAHMETFWEQFQGGGVQQDDLTMLVIKNTGVESADAV